MEGDRACAPSTPWCSPRIVPARTPQVPRMRLRLTKIVIAAAFTKSRASRRQKRRLARRRPFLSSPWDKRTCNSRRVAFTATRFSRPTLCDYRLYLQVKALCVTLHTPGATPIIIVFTVPAPFPGETCTLYILKQRGHASLHCYPGLVGSTLQEEEERSLLKDLKRYVRFDFIYLCIDPTAGTWLDRGDGEAVN